MTTAEYGIFNDEGCIERGLWSKGQADLAATEYDVEDEVTVLALCSEHEEQAANSCEICNADEEDEDGE